MAQVGGRPALVLEGKTAAVAVDLSGGSIVGFRFRDLDLNPLVWNDRDAGTAPRAMGHFLCLDRWGAPSEAERRNGMPYHGEAAQVVWKVGERKGRVAAMSADLPMAGLLVERRIEIAESAAVFTVTETVTNRNPLGRVYNMVQHPSIGPPFLDEETVVDSNGRRGFMQSTPGPNPEEPSVYWPQALKDGQPVNLRYLRDDPMPNVVSYVIEDEDGWVTAVNPKHGLLIGYVWKRDEYPWLNLWRHVENGRPLARGLEFGTTGLHQPYPILVRKGHIFGAPLVSFLDAGERTTRSYVAFLAKVPDGYKGVASVRRTPGGIEIEERGPDPRRITIE